MCTVGDYFSLRRKQLLYTLVINCHSLIWGSSAQRILSMGVSTSGSSMAKKTTTVTSLEMLPSKNAAVYLVTNCLPPTQVMVFFFWRKWFCMTPQELGCSQEMLDRKNTYMLLPGCIVQSLSTKGRDVIWWQISLRWQRRIICKH